MLRRMIVLLIVILLCGGTAYGAVFTANKYLEPVEEDINKTDFWPEMPENTNPNLKYFSYYHFGNRIPEVAAYGHANFSKADAKNLDEIQELYDNGFYIFIMIRYIFFKDGETPSDYQARWENAKTQLAPFMDKILGFYVDEPRRGKSKEAFHLACQTVLSDFPDKMMMSVMTIQALSDYEESRDYFQYCTDLAYDFYPSWSKKDVLKNIEKLETQIAVNNQNIWLVPKAFYTVSVDKDPYWISENKKLPIGKDVLDWIKGSYEIAVADHRIVGIYPFVYDNDDFDIPLRGFFAKDSPYYNEEVFGVYDRIGKAIINNN